MRTLQLAILALLGSVGSVSAQDMTLNFIDGSDLVFATNDIENILFSGDLMQVNSINGDQFNTNISVLVNYTFDNLGLVTGNDDQREMVSVPLKTYPNPTFSELRITLSMPLATVKLVEVITVDGKLIRSWPQPEQADIVWDLTDANGNQVSSGVHLCRVVTTSEVYSQTIVVQ